MILFSRISAKLFLLSAIPLLVVAGGITWLTIDSRTSEVEDTLRRTAIQLASNLASTSEFALYTSRLDLLAPVAITAKNTPAISAIAYLDTKGNTVFATDFPPGVTYGNLSHKLMDDASGNYLIVNQPVYLTETNVSDYEEIVESPATLLGWVVVLADKTEVKRRGREIFVNHLVISFVVLIGAFLLSFFLSQTVVLPIRRMSDVVREMERGNLDIHITPTTGDELAILGNGINLLARTVAEGKDTLEAKVERATEELQGTLENLQHKNQLLVEAKLSADAANQAKSDFLAQMSHELRTPITAIQGFVRLLESGDIDAPERRYCNIIQQASTQLLQLIDDLLDLTKLQSGGIELESLSFQLPDCIEHPVLLMAPIAHEKGIELIVDIMPDVPLQLIGDSLRLRQVVYNLLSNAIKFTAKGSVVVSVRSQKTAEGNVNLLLSVRDSGIGISEKQQAQIFEPFTQADTSISRRFGGSGLGLTIVKNLMELMGGSIDVRSTKGKGSVFHLTIPVEVDRAVPVVERSRYRNVLIHDSHPQGREALEHLISLFAEQIESCDDCMDLVENELAFTPDLIVYSCPILFSPETVYQHLVSIRNVHSCPVLVISPLNGALRNKAFNYDRLSPLYWMDKPATVREMARFFAGGDDGLETAFESMPVFNASVLLVEDNEFSQLLLNTILQKQGCRVQTANNGREALELSQRIKFDVILMDVHMPEVNGIEALKEIRNSEGPNHYTPIIMLTADILQQEESALFQAGADDLVFKPLDESKLFQALSHHLGSAATPVVTDQPAPVDQYLFVQEVKKLVAQAQRAIDSYDEESLRDSIHQLLGIAGIFSMPGLERAIAALHSAVKSKSEEKIFATMETLLAEVDSLEEFSV
jgi:two-component system sensor histidine kinase BarA